MDRRAVLTLVRGATAVLILVAIVWQAIDLANVGRFDPTRFFAFFTIQSNLLGAAVLLALVARGRQAPSPMLDLLRGAAALYLTITFFVVHKLSPIVVVADWLLDPPRRSLTLRHALLWLAYPLVWVIVTLIRGAGDGWYPYPFLNPANGGYASVAFYFVAILVGFLVAGALLVALGNAARTRWGEEPVLRMAG